MSLCIPTTTPHAGRVAFAQQSLTAPDWNGSDALRPAYCTGTVRCTDHARQSARLKSSARLRFEYGAGNVCAVCLLPGTFALHRDEDARLVIAHTRSVARFGSSSVRNLHAAHVACNRATGDRDLTALLPPVTRDLPTLAAAQRWSRTPNRTRIPNGLPTADEMARARDERILPDGTVGLGF